MTGQAGCARKEEAAGASWSVASADAADRDLAGRTVGHAPEAVAHETCGTREVAPAVGVDEVGSADAVTGASVREGSGGAAHDAVLAEADLGRRTDGIRHAGSGRPEEAAGAVLAVGVVETVVAVRWAVEAGSVLAEGAERARSHAYAIV